MPAVKGQPPRKRNRKRKRRQAFSSDSSSSGSSSENETVGKESPVAAKQRIEEKVPASEENEISSSNSESSDSESSSSNDNEVDDRHSDIEMRSPQIQKQTLPSRSPSPVNTKIPTNIFLNPSNDEERRKDEQLRERFRMYWMNSMAEGFRDELEQIQKEPNMTQSRLGMLIDALASGTNVYLPPHNTAGSASGTSEVELLLSTVNEKS